MVERFMNGRAEEKCAILNDLIKPHAHMHRHIKRNEVIRVATRRKIDRKIKELCRYNNYSQAFCQ